MLKRLLLALALSSASIAAAYGQAAAPVIPLVNGLPISNSNAMPINGTISAVTAQKSTAAAPTYVEGTTNPLSGDLSGNLRVIVGAALPAGAAIIGNVRIDQTTPGTTNNVTSPSIGSNGSTVKTSSTLMGVSDGTNQQQVVAPIALGDGVNGNNAVAASAWLYNGATYDRQRGDATNGTYVSVVPTASSTIGITPVVSATAESNHVFKGSAGNLYSAYVTAGATAGFLMIFNATSAPVDGAVTPLHCIQVPANQTVSLNFSVGPPEIYATGITAVFSSTGCFTKTASATAFFHGSVK